MLGNSFIAIPTNAGAGPRNQPDSTAIQFPVWRPASDASALQPITPSTAPSFFALYARIGNRMDDVKDAHLDRLNVIPEEDVPLPSLLPPEYLVPEAWLSAREGPASPEQQEQEQRAFAFPQKTLLSGKPYPGFAKFLENSTELRVSNERAWPAMARTRLPPGQTHPRIRAFYKFWNSLDQMALYWDTSDDRDDETEEQRQEQRVEGDRVKDGEAGEKKKKKKEEEKDGGYKGRRIGRGSDMPERIREEVVKAFCQAACADLGLRTLDTTVPHSVTLRSTYFPARLTGQILLPRPEPDLARKGHHTGPLIGIHCNPNTSFRKAGEEEVGRGHFERLARLQQVAAILALAQERGREGKVEVLGREGKWWASRPEWWPGGGEQWPVQTFVTDERRERVEGAEGAGKKEGQDEVLASTPGKSLRQNTGSAASANGSTGPSTRKRYRDAGKEALSMLGSGRGKPLRNPKDPPRWNGLMQYERVGAEADDTQGGQDSRWDSVFLIESVCHHVSLVRTRVSKRLVEFLERGDFGDDEGGTRADVGEEGGEDPWWVLRVQRSRWYDLLRPEDRVQLLRAVWGVSAYLVRNKSMVQEESEATGTAAGGGGEGEVTGTVERDASGDVKMT